MIKSRLPRHDLDRLTSFKQRSLELAQQCSTAWAAAEIASVLCGTTTTAGQVFGTLMEDLRRVQGEVDDMAEVADTMLRSISHRKHAGSCTSGTW